MRMLCTELGEGAGQTVEDVRVRGGVVAVLLSGGMALALAAVIRRGWERDEDEVELVVVSEPWELAAAMLSVGVIDREELTEHERREDDELNRRKAAMIADLERREREEYERLRAKFGGGGGSSDVT